jgi:hypothetical protein
MLIWIIAFGVVAVIVAAKMTANDRNRAVTQARRVEREAAAQRATVPSMREHARQLRQTMTERVACSYCGAMNPPGVKCTGCGSPEPVRT